MKSSADILRLAAVIVACLPSFRILFASRSLSNYKNVTPGSSGSDPPRRSRILLKSRSTASTEPFRGRPDDDGISKVVPKTYVTTSEGLSPRGSAPVRKGMSQIPQNGVLVRKEVVSLLLLVFWEDLYFEFTGLMS